MTAAKEKIMFWVLGILLFISFLYLTSDILLPFVVGMLVAYFLDPVADKLEKIGFSRSIATALITILFFAFFTVLAIILLPVLYEQFLSLASHMPEYAHTLNEKYGPQIERFLGTLGDGSSVDIKQKMSEFSGYIIQFSGNIIGNAWHSGVAIINIISLVFISPVVSFFMLRDWDRMVAKVDSWLPRKSAKTIREQMRLIDLAVSGYVRGMGNVCIFLGLFYAIALSLVGLEFGLFIGMGTGILCFIPYAGAFIGMTIGLVVAYFQFDDWQHIGMVLTIFIIGQFIEGNFITPRIVGNKVGLHPIWIIFGLLAGGSIFGFVGVLMAVPVTAIIGVLVRFSLKEYMKSGIYAEKSAKSKK